MSDVLSQRWKVGCSTRGQWNIYSEDEGDVTPAYADETMGRPMNRLVCEHIVRLHNTALGKADTVEP